MKKSNRKILILILVFSIFTLGLQSNKILLNSGTIDIVKGEHKSLDISFPFILDISQEQDGIVQTIYNVGEERGLKKSYNLNGIDEGNSELQLKLLGLIPVKNYDINVINRPKVIPGGNAIGVRLNTKGVLVVAVTDVIDQDGKRNSPAKDAGLRVGDNIIKINGIKVLDAQHVVDILNDIEENEVEIIVQRNKTEFETKTMPVKSIQDNCYRLGIWVRDKTSGIGTLTYLDKETKEFGALGHGITDMDTGDLLSVDRGNIMNAKISKIEQGKRGTPGEIRGVFYETDNVLGHISKNTPYGIYGDISDESFEKLVDESISIGFKEEVKEGKADILTTVEDGKIEKFEVEITKIHSQSKADQKSMIIKITDEKLLNKTGGIVQGMSGSPIIQDNRLIGAVTHVFVNDPTKGYGIYIEWMMEQTNRP